MLVLALAGTVPDAHAQQNEVYFARDTIHVTPGEELQFTPTLRYTESTNVHPHIRTVDPTESLNGYEPAEVGGGIGGYIDYTPIFDRRADPIAPGNHTFEGPVPIGILGDATPPAMGSPGKYFYVEITKVTTDGKLGSTEFHPEVTIGTPRRITVFIDHTRQTRSMPQIVLSKNTMRVKEPVHASCPDSKVGDEKMYMDITLRDGAPGVRTIRDYGPVLETETYKVQLDRTPGPGKVVSVEIWEPTDLDRPDVGRFHQNARIHGIGWPAIRQGRISIDNSPVLNRGQPVGERRHLNTYLTFTDKNWNQAKTVTVNIHCAQHDVNNPLPIWHFAFRHNEPGWGYPSYMYNRKGDNSRANTSLKIAQVRVADSAEPAAITGNPDGKLVLDPDASGHFVLSDDGEDGYAHIIGLDFHWNNPDNSLHNDYDDANEKFAGFRVRLRTVDPPGHAVQEEFVRADFIIPGDAPTGASWRAELEANGYDHAKRFASNRPDRKYEWSVVPVDRHWNDVEAERVTRCVLMTGNTLDLTANPNCPTPAPGPSVFVNICGRTPVVRDAILGRIGGGVQCGDVTPEQLAGISGSVSDNYLNLWNKGLSSLKAGDFDGLTNLKRLRMDRNSLTTLPAGIFDDLAELITLDLDNNELTTLRPDVFDSLTKLRSLYLNNNNLAALPDGVFKNNLAVSTLWLNSNPGAPFTPTTDAGTDQTVATGAEVTLSGTAPGPWASNDLAWRWRQVDGPNSTRVLQGGVQRDGQTATFTAPATPPVMHFRLAAIPKIRFESRLGSRDNYLVDDTNGIAGNPAWVTITVEAGQGSPQQDAQAAQVETPACVSDALLADAQKAASETWRTSPGHVERWSRVLAAFGVENSYSSNPMTIAEAQAQADRGLGRWAPVAPALQCLAAAPQAQPEPAEVQPATPGTPVTPELSLAAGSAVDEGGQATFTLTANPAPGSDLTVTYTVAQSGEYLDTPGAGHRTVTLAAGATSTDLSVATVDDAADEADGSVSVTLGTGTGYTVATGQGSTAVTVRDNDEPVISLAGGSGVTEGAPASFTVSASPVPAAPLDITLTVGQSGDFAASGETGSRTVTLPVTGSATVEVATVDDGADEPDGSVTATVDTGTGYTVAAAPDHTATVAVADNDAASAGPTISIADATLKENQRTGYFTVTLSEPVDWPVTVRYATRDATPVSAVAGQDYLAWERAWSIWARFNPGETETRIYVRLYNDSHDEDPETFELVLFDAAVNGPPGVAVSIADGVAVGTIENSDPMPQAWLGRFGRTVAQQALDGIASRLAAPRTPGAHGTLAGHAFTLRSPGANNPAPDDSAPGTSLLAGLAAQLFPGLANGGTAAPGGGGEMDTGAPGRFGRDAFATGAPGPGGPGIRALTLQDVLLGSHFSATSQPDAHGGSMAFWGRAAQATFDGREGAFALDGETTTAQLGTDYARDRWLVGVSLLQSQGTGGYDDQDAAPPEACAEVTAAMRAVLCGGAVREGAGAVKATLTAAVPYAAFQASERLKLWGAAGYGAGDVTLTPETGGTLTTDIAWTMAQMGLRGTVLAPPETGSGPALAVTSDALWAETTSEKVTGGLAASAADVTRLRLGLEGRWLMALERWGQLTPSLAVGARHDGGEAETGFGVELGGGLAWQAPQVGLALNVEGRTLLTHRDEEFRDQGVAASFVYDPDPATPRGPSVTLRQDWGGQATGGLEALFASAPLTQRTGAAATRSRWATEAAWGFPAFDGRFTGSPHVGVGLAAGARDYTLGWRLVPATTQSALSLALQATRRELDAAQTVHTVGLEVTTQW